MSQVLSIEEVRSKLFNAESTLTRLLNRLPGMAYRCRVTDDFQYSLEFASRGCQAMIGIPPEEYNSNHIEQMMPDADRLRARNAMKNAILAGKAYKIYYRITMPETGQEKWIWDQGEGLYDDSGNCLFVEGIMMDVTEQKSKELSLKAENRKLRLSIKDSYGLGKIIGKSAAMQRCYRLLLRAAQSDTNIALYGETGVGKELAARTMHDLSNVKGRFVPVNCAAIPDQLLESEFFGYMKGAFSGATTNHNGYLAAANGGTLFLDEVGELPLRLQGKLLRALESRTYTPVGSSEVRQSDFRLVCATNRSLEEMVRRGEMRSDFYYRIHVLPIHLPALRERMGDIPLLVDAYARARGVTAQLPAPVLMAMEQYTWPGNVRELQNALDRYWAFGEMGLHTNLLHDIH
ncbi:sigma 54-interacting transcriptional regulator, partial [Desulfovibrio sp. OttesenSCG-928-G15]|nr:sigma 54-interacting transcriptional regulator [Desulfovibrio sp. OttesenSCG-928-G15]